MATGLSVLHSIISVQALDKESPTYAPPAISTPCCASMMPEHHELEILSQAEQGERVNSQGTQTIKVPSIAKVVTMIQEDSMGQKNIWKMIPCLPSNIHILLYD